MHSCPTSSLEQIFYTGHPDPRSSHHQHEPGDVRTRQNRALMSTWKNHEKSEVKKGTPPKTNMPSENQWLVQMYVSYWNNSSLGDVLVFRGVNFQTFPQTTFFFGCFKNRENIQKFGIKNQGIFWIKRRIASFWEGPSPGKTDKQLV